MPLNSFSKVAVLALFAVTGLVESPALRAAQLTDAQITQIINDVRTVDPAKAPRPAKLNETLQGEQAVRTGVESRTELLFNDQTLTRLGANTRFSFAEGTRNMALDQGVMLLQVPKNHGGAKIQTAAVTAAITGTTIFMEVGKNYTKFIVMEGTALLSAKGDPRHRTVTVKAGQEIIMPNNSRTVPAPVYVNLKVLAESSGLLGRQWRTDIDWSRIYPEIARQTSNFFTTTNLAIMGEGTSLTVIDQHAVTNNPQNPFAPGVGPGSGNGPSSGGHSAPGPGNPPSATVAGPGKYGPLQTITSSNPFVIGSSSALNTDPKITTPALEPALPAIVDEGKIYRGPNYTGPEADAPLADYLFGVGSGLKDSVFGREFGDLPSGVDDSLFPAEGVAAFRFSELSVDGAPILTTEGGARDLVLISEGGITFSIPEGPSNQNWAPLRSLTLATLAGSIALDAGPAITGLSSFLRLFNRGTGNDIDLRRDLTLPGARVLIDTEGRLCVEGTQTFAQGEWTAVGGITLKGSTTATGQLTLVSGEGDVKIRAAGLVAAQAVQISATNINVAGRALIGTIGESGPVFGEGFDSYNFWNASGTIDVGGDVQTSGFLGLYAGGDVTLHASPRIVAGGLYASGTNITIGGSVQADSYFDNQATGAVTVSGTVQSNEFSASGQTFSGTGSISTSDLTVTTTSNTRLVLNGTTPAVNGVSLNPARLRSVTLEGSGVTVQNGFAPASSHFNQFSLSLTASDDGILLQGTIQAQEFKAFSNSAVHFIQSAGEVATTIDAVRTTLEDTNDHTLSQDSDTGDLTLNETIVLQKSRARFVRIVGNSIIVNTALDLPDVDLEFVARSRPLEGETLFIPPIIGLDGESVSASSLRLSADGTIRLGGSVTVAGEFEAVTPEDIVADTDIFAGSVRLEVGTDVHLSQIPVEAGGPLLRFLSDEGLLDLHLPGDDASPRLHIAGRSVSLGSSINFANLSLELVAVGGEDDGGPAFRVAFAGPVGPSLSGNIFLPASIQVHDFTASAAGELLPANAESVPTITAQSVALTVGVEASVFRRDGAGGGIFYSPNDFSEYIRIQPVADEPFSFTLAASSIQVGDFFDASSLSLISTASITTTGTISSVSTVSFDAGDTITARAIQTPSLLMQATQSIAVGPGVQADTFIAAAGSDIHSTDGSIIHGTSGGAVHDLEVHLGAAATVGQTGKVISFRATVQPPGTQPLQVEAATAAQVILEGQPLTVASALHLPGADGTSTDTPGKGTELALLNSSLAPFAAGPDGSAGINVNGGDAVNAAHAGGDGGRVSVFSPGDIAVHVPITATTGVNGTGVTFGGSGGQVDLTSAGGAVHITSKIEVSSDDAAGRRRSASGGRINVTSLKTSGPAITVSSTAELNALLNNAAPGAGGAITFVSSGGDILVNGKVTASKGQVEIRNDGDGSTGLGLVQLNGATVSADVVKIGALGANGELRIGNSAISAATAMKLYAGGTNGRVRFVGDTQFSGSGLKTIAARTVTIDNGHQVSVSGGSAKVFTNNPNYNKSSYGSFTGNGVTTAAFEDGSKPGF